MQSFSCSETRSVPRSSQSLRAGVRAGRAMVVDGDAVLAGSTGLAAAFGALAGVASSSSRDSLQFGFEACVLAIGLPQQGRERAYDGE